MFNNLNLDKRLSYIFDVISLLFIYSRASGLGV